VSELIGYAQFLDRRERRRTADRGRAFAGATDPPPTEGAPAEALPRETRTDRAMALAAVATPMRGPVPRWRGPAPTSPS
jgi:hypothetical protein